MKKATRATLVEGEETRLLIKLTIPMIFGLLSMILYNLVDTFFVGQLGKNQLAALSFTFPVVLTIQSLALGIGIGTSSIMSRALGRDDISLTKRYATDSLSLGILIVAVVVLAGFLTLNPLFTLLGAKNIILGYIKEYMKIWYIGMLFVVIPMIGNNAMRAVGDSKTPGTIMVIGAVSNSILDPFLIFGIGFFPRLEIKGAAIATVIGRGITFLITIYVLYFKKNLLLMKLPKLKEIFNSWGKILYIGIPNAIIKMIIPLGMGVITGIISRFGASAVAAYGVATRIEFFSLAIINALSSIIGPFIGQNWGAKKYNRVCRGFKSGEKLSIIVGLVATILLFIFAKPIASIFSKNKDIIKYLVLFLYIAPISYAAQGIFLIAGASLNALNKPFHAAGLSFIEMFILYIPLAIFLSNIIGVLGIFIALCFAYIVTGIFSHITFFRVIEKYCE